ncbi:hypothetical protein ACFY3J_38035 [Streptomyces sp. NPDC001231]|uniref:hypothetical protein n=1 Tax=Streptomyces sp. NPDC001231 TaxID=3364549 RepID=UPI003689FCB4
MPAEQIGRWTSVDNTLDFAADSGPDAALALACSLHALNEVSSGVAPAPAAARLIIARPDGTPLGVLGLDEQDAEILAKRVHTMSADRYGPLNADDLATLARQLDGRWHLFVHRHGAIEPPAEVPAGPGGVPPSQSDCARALARLGYAVAGEWQSTTGQARDDLSSGWRCARTSRARAGASGSWSATPTATKSPSPSSRPPTVSG